MVACSAQKDVTVAPSSAATARPRAIAVNSVVATTTPPPKATTTTTTIAPMRPVHIQDLLPDVDSLWPAEYGAFPKWGETGLAAPDDQESQDGVLVPVTAAYRWRRSTGFSIGASAEEGTPEDVAAIEAGVAAETETSAQQPEFHTIEGVGGWSGWCTDGATALCRLGRRVGQRYFRVRSWRSVDGTADISVLERVTAELAAALDAQVSALLVLPDQPGLGAADLGRRGGPDDLLIRFDDLAAMAGVDRALVEGRWYDPDQLDPAVSDTGAVGQGERIAFEPANEFGFQPVAARIGVVAYASDVEARAAYDTYLTFETGVGPWGFQSLSSRRAKEEAYSIGDHSCVDLVLGVHCGGFVREKVMMPITGSNGKQVAEMAVEGLQLFDYAMFVNGSRLYYAIDRRGNAKGSASVVDLVAKQAERLRSLGLM
jgi:hypothetical protein